MLSFGDGLSRIALVVTPAAALTYGFSLIPHNLVVGATSVLAAWLALSLPVGILIGHFVIEEADGRYSPF